MPTGIIDNVYVNVQLPQPVLSSNGSLYNGAAAGMTCWGPKNTPLTSSTPTDLLRQWGPPINLGRDLVQDGALFLKQFPLGGFIGVRVTDGTDAAATVDLMDSAGTPANGLVLTALYTGTLGNSISVSLSTGSNYQSSAKTWKIVVSCNGTTEVFDRIAGNTGSVVWTNLMNAINNGLNAQQPPSNFITAALPGTPSVILPPTTTQTVTLVGGTNGGVPTTSQMIGVDGGSGSRTGMYALRQSGFDLCWLAGNTDTTSWSTVLAFAKSETAMGIGSMPLGTSVATAVTDKLTAGIDDPYMILCVSWITYLDTQLNVQVEIPSTPVIAGVICSLQPHQSPGNRKVYGILGTEQTLGSSPQPYSNSDMGTLEANGITFVNNPIPSANTFGVRHGKNTSSNSAISEIPYGRKTNQIVKDLRGPVMGQFVNRLQTTNANDPLRQAVLTAIDGYFGPQKSGTAPSIVDYTRVCDLTNNLPSQIRSGNLRADIQVEYMSVVDDFNINIIAGQTVDVTAANTPVQ